MARGDRGGDRGREAGRAPGPLDAGVWGAFARPFASSPSETARERKRRRWSTAGEPDPDVADLRVPGAYARRNFAVARAAAAAGHRPAGSGPGARRRRRPGAARDGCRSCAAIPRWSSTRRTTRDGAGALAEALPEAVGGAPVVACLAMLGRQGRRRGASSALAPQARRSRCAPSCPPGGSRAPGGPARTALGAGRAGRGRPRTPGIATEIDARAGRAAVRAGRRRRSSAVGRGARLRFALPSTGRMDREARSELLQMMGLVAAVVAIVILVFFGLGYLFGRLFL